jgi:hypothetical protein
MPSLHDTTAPLVLDLDDFCEENHSLDLLDALREEIGPPFRASLFTIPARCSLRWLDWIRSSRPWLELIPHGFFHATPRECENWSLDTMRSYLLGIEPMGLVRGFKAPGWLLNPGVYTALVENRYWIADKVENRARRPFFLPAYELDEPRKIHGHIGHLGGYNTNELSLIAPAILDAWHRHFLRLDRDAAFGFASRDLTLTGNGPFV